MSLLFLFDLLPLEESHEALAVDFFGFLDAHEVENGGGDIGEESFDLRFFAHHFFGALLVVIIRGDKPERDRIFGMFGVFFTGFEVANFFDIAVVGCDEDGAACLKNGWNEQGEAFIGRFDGFDRGLFVAGVSYHVGTRIIQENKIVFSRSYGFDGFAGGFGGTHFRNFVEMGN